MTAPLQELIGKLEAATGPDRELDCRIEAVMKPGWSAQLVDYTTGPSTQQTMTSWAVAKDGTWYHAPRFTSSVDEALKLVPEGFAYKLEGWMAFTASVFVPEKSYVTAHVKSGMALALCIAALKARDALTPTQPTPHRKDER